MLSIWPENVWELDCMSHIFAFSLAIIYKTEYFLLDFSQLQLIMSPWVLTLSYPHHLRVLFQITHSTSFRYDIGSLRSLKYRYRCNLIPIHRKATITTHTTILRNAPLIWCDRIADSNNFICFCSFRNLAWILNCYI